MDLPYSETKTKLDIKHIDFDLHVFVLYLCNLRLQKKNLQSFKTVTVDDIRFRRTLKSEPNAPIYSLVEKHFSDMSRIHKNGK